MVVRRSLGNGRLLAMVIIGMIFASGLMASVVIYSDAIRDLGLKHALETAPVRSLDLRVSSSSQPLRVKEYAVREEKTATLLRDLAGDITEDKVRFARTATFFLTPPDGPVPAADGRPRANLQFSDHVTQHVKLVEGKAPAPAPTTVVSGTPPTFEVWIGQEAATKFGVKVGDVFDLHPFWRLEVAPLRVTVAGIVTANDPTERYWFGKDRLFEVTASWQTYIFLTDERVLTELLSVYLPDIDASVETFAFVDITRINSRNAKAIEGRLNALKVDLERGITRTQLESNLAPTIKQYRDKLFFTRLPLFALMIQVVGIVLYYLVMVSTMVVDRQAGEIALLKSRGASVFQIMGIYFLESLFLSTIALVLGPLLIAAAISLLGYTPPFEDLSGNGRLAIHVSGQAFGLAALGALLGMAAMLWPAYKASQLSVVHYKTHMARPQKQSVFLRYYLDLALIAVGAFAFYQLRQRGSLVTDKLFGGFSADPLLLATPTLFMLMMALLFLRIFPIGLRIVSWAAKGLNGATVPLGLWHVVRSPLQYTRLILLLILATAVGMFAAGFGATLERSYDDRAAYQGGADGRLVGIRNPTGVSNASLTKTLKEATGAELVTPAARMSASYSVTTFQSLDVSLLGVVPEEFSQIAFWREDFASQSLAGLLKGLDNPEATVLGEAQTVEAGVRNIGVWVKSTLPANQFALSARLRDQDGVVLDYRMIPFPGSQPGADGFQFYIGTITNPPARSGLPPGAPLAFPLRFEALGIRPSGGPAAPQRVAITLDEFQVSSLATPAADTGTRGFSDGIVVEGFESLERYQVIRGASASLDSGAISRTSSDVKGGTTAAVVAFAWQRSGIPVTGIRVRGYGGPLNVIVNKSFLAAANKKVGDELSLYAGVQYVTIRIAGTFDFFPGYDPSKSGNHFLADLRALQIAATTVPSSVGVPFANEAWLKGVTESSLTTAELAKHSVQVERSYDRAALRRAASADPLVAASWSGILFLSFVSVLVLTAIGFIVSSHLAAQTRSLEFAILRTMGFTGRQILSLVSLEQCFVVVAGLSVGTLLGLPLVRLMIGYLGINEAGAEVLPPMVSRVNWTAVLVADGILLAVFIGTILSLAWTYTRLAVSRTLRMGEL